MLSIAIFIIVAGSVLWLVLYMLAQKEVTLVQSLIHQARYAEAAEQADRVLEKNPVDAPTHLHKAEALKLLGRFDEALTSYRRTLELRRDDAAAREGTALTLSYLGRELGEARRLMEETLQQFPQILEFQSLSLAFILLRTGLRDEALRLYADNLELLQTRFELDYTDADPLLAETIYLDSELAAASGDRARADSLRAKVQQFAPASIFAKWASDVSDSPS